MITDQDLVEWQLEVASGNPLPLSQDEIPLIGHAFEARIYAENPRNNFLPDVGPLLHLSTPTPSNSVRLEEGFLQGSNIELYYDPLISKLVVRGRDRTEALRILRKALEEYQVVGVSTNIEFLRTLAGNEYFINGEVETGFIQVCFVVSLLLSVFIRYIDLLLTVRNTMNVFSPLFPNPSPRC